MPNQKVRLSKSVVAEAQPTDREYVLWDNRLAGFGLRVRPSGAKSFIYVYRSPGGRRGTVRRVTLKGSHPDVAFEAAKKEAVHFHGGGDPVAERAAANDAAAKARKVLAVGTVLDRFIEDHAKPELAGKTATEYERIVGKLLKPAIGSISVDKLEPTDVAAMRDKLRGTPTQAVQAVRVLSSAMSWAEEAGLRSRGPNPARIRLKGSRRRTRLFTDAEVARLQATIDELTKENRLTPTVALGLRLLFATGCRAGEICSLQWSNVDLAERLMRWPRSKTGFLEKPITEEAAKLLKSAERIVGVDWVCPSIVNKSLRVETLEAGFERVMKRAKVEAKENASLHLIRHWFATRTYTDKSIPLPVQMAIVGHSSVATAMRYAHVGRDEMRRAAEAASKRRTSAVKAAGKRGRVVRLGSGR
jgi:integrase